MTLQSATRWHAFDSQDAINQAATTRILQAADVAIKQYGSFILC